MFRLARMVTFLAVVAALAALTGGAGAMSKPAASHASRASTASTHRAALLRTANLRTRAGAVAYLRAIGVDPRGVVVQAGARNYAGPSCPGTGWTCASTAHPVVQIAMAGGQNRFLCRTAGCAVVQTTAAATATNTATCIKTTGITQSCSISQSSATADNQAIVFQQATKLSGLTQTASSTAQITQQATGASNSNTACVNQAITVDGSTVAKKGIPVTVTLEAHQSIAIAQDAAQGGNTVGNAVGSSASASCDASNPLQQSQQLTSTATGTGSITQNENAADSGANVSLDIEQNQSPGFLGSATGPNTAKFNQVNTLKAIANTPAGPVSQTQSSANGGILASVNQDSRTSNTANATQTETQCEDAHASTSSSCDVNNADPPSYSLTQTQFGPVRKDNGNQTGNGSNTFTVNQNSTQNNDTGRNQTNVVHGDCNTSSGSCTVNQTANVDGTPSSSTQTGSSVDSQISCSGNVCTTPTGFSATHVDLAEFGVGGMRDIGSSSITVSGVGTGTVTRALLYWHGPTRSSDPAANAAVTFNGSPVTGTNIGFASDNNWGFDNSQAYRADVTSLVSGDGTYTLANFTKPDININGVALIVFYNDGNPANDRNAYAWNGNDSNIASSFDPADWSETIPNVNYPGSGSASLDLVVSDGQSYSDADVVLNGNTGDPVVAGPSIFQGLSGPNYSGNPSGVTGSLWDVESFDITRFLTSGSQSLTVTSGTAVDALSLIVAIANVPSS